MARILDSLSLPLVLFVAVILGFSPFVPEPHIFEKLRMLGQGALTRPLDIFDLVYHSLGFLLLIAKLARMWVKRRA
jgi:hypothetical protein